MELGVLARIETRDGKTRDLFVEARQPLHVGRHNSHVVQVHQLSFRSRNVVYDAAITARTASGASVSGTESRSAAWETTTAITSNVAPAYAHSASRPPRMIASTA